MRPLLERLTRVLERVLAVAFLAAVCLNLVNVVGRYVFGHVMLSADEIQIYTVVVMTFVGAAVVTWRSAHIRMDLLLNLLPARARSVVAAVEAVVLAAIAGFVAWQSLGVAKAMFQIGRVSDSAGIPMWIVHGLVMLGFALLALCALVRRPPP